MTFLSFYIPDVIINYISSKKKMQQSRDFACNCYRIFFEHSIFFKSCWAVCFLIIYLYYLNQDKNATCGKPQFFQIGQFTTLFGHLDQFIANLLSPCYLKKVARKKVVASIFSIIDLDWFNLQLIYCYKDIWTPL